MSQAVVYLIRHGEKPEPEADGLSEQGVKRSEALPGVFGPESPYKLAYIMAEHPKKGELVRFLSKPLQLSCLIANMSISTFSSTCELS